MASEHTPGPWALFHHKDSGARYIDSGSVQMQISRTSDAGAGDMDANARLIAAAPDLLGTLQDLHNRLSEAVQLGLTAQEAYDSFYQEMVGEALSKATGASHE